MMNGLLDHKNSKMQMISTHSGRVTEFLENLITDEDLNSIRLLNLVFP
jgi:hypothetical protein